MTNLKGKGRLPLETWTGTSLRVRMRKEKEKGRGPEPEGRRGCERDGSEEPFQKSPSRPPPQQPPSKVTNQCPNKGKIRLLGTLEGVGSSLSHDLNQHRVPDKEPERAKGYKLRAVKSPQRLQKCFPRGSWGDVAGFRHSNTAQQVSDEWSATETWTVRCPSYEDFWHWTVRSSKAELCSSHTELPRH